MFIAIHIPAWIKRNNITVNGQPVDAEIKDGYAHISRQWCKGDVIKLTLSMEARQVYANTNVREDAGCVALLLGLVVYCLEEVDNGACLSALRLPRLAELQAKRENIQSVGDVVVLEADGVRLKSEDELYSDMPPEAVPVKLRMIPYYTWGNRSGGEMRVWVLEN